MNLELEDVDTNKISPTKENIECLQNNEQESMKSQKENNQVGIEVDKTKFVESECEVYYLSNEAPIKPIEKTELTMKKITEKFLIEKLNDKELKKDINNESQFHVKCTKRKVKRKELSRKQEFKLTPNRTDNNQLNLEMIIKKLQDHEKKSSQGNFVPNIDKK